MLWFPSGRGPNVKTFSLVEMMVELMLCGVGAAPSRAYVRTVLFVLFMGLIVQYAEMEVPSGP